MADNKPNVTVIYQDAKSSLPTLWSVIGEIIVFAIIGGIIAWWIR